MILNYIKIACRNLWRNKGYSFLNVFGLAVALAISTLIFLFISDELSFDKHHEKADRIYRIDADFLVNGNTFHERTVPAPFGEVLKKENPQIEEYARVTQWGQILVKKGNETLIEKNSAFADGSLFKIFTIPMLAGNPETALAEPNTIVISEKISKKYFGKKNPIGSSLLINNSENYKVTGVFKDMPLQSHVHYDFLRSMTGLEDSRQANWMSDNYETYLLVRPTTTEFLINKILKETTKKYMDGPLKTMIGNSIAKEEQKGGHFRYNVIPLTDIHLKSNITNEAEPPGDIQTIYIFFIVGLFILFIAGINVINLTTAISSDRFKEVGVRKVIGSNRISLIYQFLTESFLTSFIALIISILFAMILLPYINQLSGKELSIDFVSNPILSLILVSITLCVGLLSGIYPALFLSALKPIVVLKGAKVSNFKGGWLRNSLVVFQFSTTIILIIGTFAINNQLKYIRNKNLGYNRQQVLVLKNTASLFTHANTFKEEITQLPGVESAAISNMLPTSLNMNTNIYSKNSTERKGNVMGISQWNIDAGFLPTMQIEISKGRNFTPLMQTDSNKLIINESAARLLQFKNPIGKELYANGKQYSIIGVTKDFNTGSLRTKTPPLVMHFSNYPNVISFRVKTNNLPDLIKKIEAKYHSIAGMSGQPFEYSFLDDDFNSIYKSEQRSGKIFISFASIAVLIACLGLFGLSTYAAKQRKKEIGIRKVLGASVTQITGLLSKDFLQLILIAIIIAMPIAWYAVYTWLMEFEYRVNINFWIFALAGILSIVIALITISFQAIKAALANPIKSLRTE